MDSNLKGSRVGHPFLVTGLGGSGTRFLAAQFDSSPNWKVHHEPNSEYYLAPQPFTGSVDSTVRHCSVVDDYLAEERLWIVVRHPSDIAMHCVRKGTWSTVKRTIAHDLERIYQLLEDGARILQFSWITRAMDLVRVQRNIGINDIPSGFIVSPIGHAKVVKGRGPGPQAAAANEVMKLGIAQDYVEFYVDQ